MDEVTIMGLDELTNVDRSADYFEVHDANANQSKRTNVNNALGIAGAPVGTSDNQTLTNKTLTSPTINTPNLTVLDSGLILQDNLDTTKQAQFQLSGITTGTTRTYTLPNGTTTLVGTDVNQTLTNKTLTSPTINNPTLNVDTISEFTSAAGVTIDGVLLKDSKMNGSYITDDSLMARSIDFASTSSSANGGIWWEELGRVTLSGAADSMSITGIPVRKYLKLLVTNINSGAIQTTMRWNNDTGANYSLRYSDNYGAGATIASSTPVGFSDAGPGSYPSYAVIYVTNIASQEKLAQSFIVAQNTAGAANVPLVRTIYWKWANTSSAITRVDVANTGAGDLAAGSEVVVLGHN